MKSNDNAPGGDGVESANGTVDRPDGPRTVDGVSTVVTDVVMKLAATLDEQPVDIEPLARSIDPAALSQLVDTTDEFELAFDHAGCRVRILRDTDRVDVEVTRLTTDPE